MNTRKMTSVVCAMCMLLSIMAVPVSAVEDRATYAGTTMCCKVVVVGENGMHTEDVYIPIPANATKDEQARLVNAAAMAAVEPTTWSNRGGYDNISTKTSLNIASGWDWNVGGGKLSNTYKQAIVEFVGITPTGSMGVATEMIVTIRNDVSPGASQVERMDIHKYPALVIFVSDKVSLAQGSTLSVAATTDAGGATVDTCRVWGDSFG